MIAYKFNFKNKTENIVIMFANNKKKVIKSNYKLYQIQIKKS